MVFVSYMWANNVTNRRWSADFIFVQAASSPFRCTYEISRYNVLFVVGVWMEKLAHHCSRAKARLEKKFVSALTWPQAKTKHGTSVLFSPGLLLGMTTDDEKKNQTLAWQIQSKIKKRYTHGGRGGES